MYYIYIYVLHTDYNNTDRQAYLSIVVTSPTVLDWRGWAARKRKIEIKHQEHYSCSRYFDQYPSLSLTCTAKVALSFLLFGCSSTWLILNLVVSLVMIRSKVASASSPLNG